MPKRGPSTPAGKAAVRLNAVRHAVLSQTPVLPDVESEKDWQQHRARLFGDLNPEGALECSLVERIALTLWQHQRLVRYQSAATVQGALDAVKSMGTAAIYAERQLGVPFDDTVNDETIERRVLESLIPKEETLRKIIRYEAHLNRQLYQALHELEALQDRRHGRDAPLARLDLNAPPS
ncbi:MAG: hypothetical protein WD379_07830 [Dehalococcoidia bacterium]